MILNINETIKFYENYNPCKCGDCKFFYENFENKYKEVFNYLLSLGVNPSKPIESQAFRDFKDSKIVYSVFYLVMGELEEGFCKKIGDVEIIESFDYIPEPEAGQNYFVLEVNKLEFYRTGTCCHDMTKSERIHVIRNCISKDDPIGLLALKCPVDEYEPEAKKIDLYLCLKRNYIDLWKLIKKVFYDSFDESIEDKICKAIAYNITCSIEFSLFEKEMNEYEELKDKIAFNEDYSIELKVNDYFIVKQIQKNTFINNKFYSNIEEQDFLESFLNFVTDKDTIYVQYKHKHLTFDHHPFKYFKLIPREKFKYNNLKHKRDIDIIFDFKGKLQMIY